MCDDHELLQFINRFEIVFEMGYFELDFELFFWEGMVKTGDFEDERA